MVGSSGPRDIAHDIILALDCALTRTRARAHHFDLDHARALARVLSHVRARAQDLDVALAEDPVSAHDFAHALVHDLDFACTLDRDLALIYNRALRLVDVLEGTHDLFVPAGSRKPWSWRGGAEWISAIRKGTRT